jgi:hypothetical protein
MSPANLCYNELHHKILDVFYRITNNSEFYLFVYELFAFLSGVNLGVVPSAIHTVLNWGKSSQEQHHPKGLMNLCA